MIIPIGHEQNRVRRQPWVTYSIMLLCVLAFLATHFARQAQLQAFIRLLTQTIEYYVQHPYLELDERLKMKMVQGVGPEAAGAFWQLTRRLGVERPRDPGVAAAQQGELDRLTRETFAAAEGMPDRRWGLIAAHVSAVDLITYMFLHGGWMHLLFNLFFLYLSGPFIEDVWGRPLFAGFYLAAGVVAALTFAWRYPHVDGPLVGASGAVAGVMGAFLIRHWKKKIRFFYWFAFIWRGTFSSPAWVVLPLWFLKELFTAHTMDVILPGSGGGGVAYWAHVGGFAFGAVAAAAVRLSGFEKRYIDPALDSKMTVVENPALEKALAAREEGRLDEAWRLLWREARTGSGGVDTDSTVWDLAVEMGRAEQAAPVLLRTIRQQIQHGDAMPAYLHWRELLERVPGAAVPAALEAKLVEELARENLREETVDVARVALGRVDAQTPAGVLARLARYGDARTRAEAAALALAHPDLPNPARRELEAVVATAKSAPTGGAPRGHSDRVSPGVRDGALKVTTGIPLGLEEDRLVVQLPERGRASLPLQRVKAVAVAALRTAAAPAELVLDLMLDAPWDEGADLRVLRLQTSLFDPQKLVPSASDADAAFCALVDRVLAVSGAIPLPDPVSVRAKPMAVYGSLEAYEQKILEAARSSPRPV
jgi:membrane associated rhomboid family serine protease